MTWMKAEEVRPIVGPFNENARCEKCGGDDIFTRFVEATEACPTGARCHPATPDHMMRRCERCRFSWWESPLGGVNP